MPDALAIYAAAVGSASLGWQIYREIRRLKTDLRVEIEHAARPRPMYVAFGSDSDPRPEPLEYELTLVVVNDGETTEYVRDAAIEDAARTAGYDFGDELADKELRPRNRVFAQVRVQDLEFDPSHGFYGVARLASGREIKSRVERLDNGVLEHIEEWNRKARP